MGKLKDAKQELDALLEEFGTGPITEADFDTIIEVAIGDLALNEAPTNGVRMAPLLEAAAPRVIVPKKGKVVEDDGACQLAVMRPCISRGRRLRGLPPMYESAMLARNAGVFRNWPMFQDHMPPEVMEALAKKGRSVSELGGRIVESWYDPDFVSADDDEFGYWKGAVRAKAIAQDPIARMIERDPDVLHCSINAWPTSARPKTHDGTKTMAVEGIRPRPIGSVDWVIRGGAGGRVLNEEEHAEAIRRVVTVLGEHYTSRHAMPEKAKTPDFSKMDAAELREYLTENAPKLVPALREEETDPEVARGRSTAAVPGSLTEERIEEIVTERVDAAVAKVTESVESQSDRLEERAQEIVNEREGQRELATRAHKVIEAAVGITPKMRADLLGRYAVLPSGATQAIQLCESEADDEKPADKVLEEMLEADIEHCQEIVREAQGRPPVRKQGGDPGAGSGSGSGRTAEVPYWRRMAVAEGVLDKPEEAVKMFGDLPGGED